MMKCKDCDYYKKHKNGKCVCIRPLKTLRGFYALAEQDVYPEMKCNYNDNQEVLKHA